jgi:catalase
MIDQSTKQGCPIMTTSSGRPVADNQNSVMAGLRDPVLEERLRSDKTVTALVKKRGLRCDLRAYRFEY